MRSYFKAITVFSLILVALGLGACSSDDGAPTAPQEVSGIWQIPGDSAYIDYSFEKKNQDPDWLVSLELQVMFLWSKPAEYVPGYREGWVAIDVELAESGDTLGARVVDFIGDQSLVDASTHALSFSLPQEPWPAERAAGATIVHLVFHYPRVSP